MFIVQDVELQTRKYVLIFSVHLVFHLLAFLFAVLHPPTSYLSCCLFSFSLHSVAFIHFCFSTCFFSSLAQGRQACWMLVPNASQNLPIWYDTVKSAQVPCLSYCSESHSPCVPGLSWAMFSSHNQSFGILQKKDSFPQPSFFPVNSQASKTGTLTLFTEQ